MSLIKSTLLIALFVFVAVSAKPKPLFKKQSSPRGVCAGTGFVSTASGSMISPNYPNDYDADDVCEWYITAPNGGRIAVIIHDLQTEESFDVVSIRDGFSINSPVLIELSGKATNVGVVSTGTQLYLGFAADYSINDRGFNASWTEVLVPNATNWIVV